MIEGDTINRDILFDKNYAEYKHVSELSFGIDRIPEKILNRAHKIFSKHNSVEIRDWSAQLMKSYQMLHAVEKPMNLDYVKPFANTSDLINLTPNIHEQVAKAKDEERKFSHKHTNQENADSEETPTQTIVLEEE